MPDAPPPRNSLVRPIPLGHVNAFLIRGDRPVLVDTGVPGSAPKILSVLQEEGYTPRDLALIIITHVHSDHFGSAAALVEATGAPVLVPADEAEALAGGASLPPVPRALIGHILTLMIGKEVPVPELGVAAAIRVDAPYRLDTFGVDGTVVPTPGHTHGSLSVQLATGEWIVGDLVMGMFPAHRPRLPFLAEDMDAARKTIRTVIDARPAIVYAGHGGPFTCGQLEALR